MVLAPRGAAARRVARRFLCRRQGLAAGGGPAARAGTAGVDGTPVEPAPASPAEQKDPWHVFSPNQLAVVNTAGNLCALAAAAAHDHMHVRALAGTAATCVLAFNVLMPKPLKTHQRTAAAWGFVFASLHFVNLGVLYYEQSHRISLSDEEEEIYESGFYQSGVTPRQFQKLLKAGSKFKFYKPHEVIVEEGKPVDRLFYVTSGSCQGMRGKENTVIMEYPENVFLGELRPSRWRAEFLGCGETLKALDDEDQDVEAVALEEAWLITEASKARRSLSRSRSQSRGMRHMLSEGLQDRLGQTTKICAGSAWTTKMAAGPEGCTMLTWPLGAFTCVVGAEEKFVKAMERVDEMSLASKVCADVKDRAFLGYHELLECVVSDGRIDPAEKLALNRYRVRHSIPLQAHVKMLQELGWTEAEYTEGIQSKQWRSKLLAWRKEQSKEVELRAAS